MGTVISLGLKLVINELHHLACDSFAQGKISGAIGNALNQVVGAGISAKVGLHSFDTTKTTLKLEATQMPSMRDSRALAVLLALSAWW